MADLTLKLIWYRLNESGANVATSVVGILAEYDVLNVLLLGWIVFAGCIFIAVTFYQNVTQAKEEKAAYNSGRAVDSSGPTQQQLPSPSSCYWINSVTTWLHKRNCNTAQITPSLLHALSEESRGYKDDWSVSFEAVLPGSKPPYITAVSTSAGPAEILTLTLTAQFRDVQMSILVASKANASKPSGVVQASQQPQRATLSVRKLDSKINIQLTNNGDSVSAAIKLEDGAVAQLDVQAHGSSSGSGEITSSGFTTSGDHGLHAHIIRVLSTATLRMRLPELVCENTTLMRSHQPTSNSPVPPKPPRASSGASGSGDSNNLRLSVKLRKATGVGAPNAGNTSPYCRVELDQPAQVYITSVAVNTVNPYWDEHFLFEASTGSKIMKFIVLDKEKESADNFLGQAIFDLDRAQAAIPGCRQVLPLLEASSEYGRSSTCISGSITVEVQFMGSAADADAESPQPLLVPGSNASSAGTVSHGHTASQRSQQQLPPGAAADSKTCRELSAGALVRSRSSMFHLSEQENADRTDWTEHEAFSFRDDTSMGRSEADLLHNIDFSNAAVVIVSPEQMADAASRELRRQLGLPRTAGSRTSTVVITSMHKEPIIKVPDDPFEPDEFTGSIATPERLPSDSTGSAADGKERKSRLSAFKRHFSKSKDKKARSHSIERSTDIDSSLKPLSSPDKVLDSADSVRTATLDASAKQSSGGNVRKLFAPKKRSSGSGSRSPPPSSPESSQLPVRLNGVQSYLQSTGAVAAAVVVPSGLINVKAAAADNAGGRTTDKPVAAS